jgi:hypothetical protein
VWQSGEYVDLGGFLGLKGDRLCVDLGGELGLCGGTSGGRGLVRVSFGVEEVLCIRALFFFVFIVFVCVLIFDHILIFLHVV